MAKLRSTPITGLLENFPDIFPDIRSQFFATFCQYWSQTKGFDFDFVENNTSISQKGTVYGLHFQKSLYTQAKGVRRISEKVRDVVNIRKGSASFEEKFSTGFFTEKYKSLDVSTDFDAGVEVSEYGMVVYKFDHEPDEGVIIEKNRPGIALKEFKIQNERGL